MTRYDYDFDAEALDNTASAIFSLARGLGPKVLDLGSGPAVVASRLANELQFNVTSIDFDAEALAVARERGVGRTLVHDLMRGDWFDEVRGETFDVVILANVLEYLARPQDVLAAIRDLALLAPGGRIVLSMPNASHEMVISSLLADDVRYSETGVMDQPHIHWFTTKSMQQLLQSEGFGIEGSVSIIRTLEQTSPSDPRVDLDPELRRMIRDRVPHASVYQYVFVVAPLDELVTPTGADDDVVRRAASLAHAVVTGSDEAARRGLELNIGELTDELARRDAHIAQLSSLLRETREHTARELEIAATEQARLERSLAAATEAAETAKEIAATEQARLKRSLAAATEAAEKAKEIAAAAVRPSGGARRLAGRAKRRLRRVFR